MKELTTPFGTLYIDEWNSNPDERYAEDRITIYDSRKDFLDYFSIDYFYDGWDEETDGGNEEIYAQQQYNELCEMLRHGGCENTIEEFIDWLGVNFCYAGKDKKQAAIALSDGHPEELLPDELETNEYVNHIGEYYIVSADI